MNIGKSILALAVSAPTAFASDFAGGEIGYGSHPTTSSVTREQVRAELQAFRKHPVLSDGSVYAGGEVGSVGSIQGAFADREPATPHTHILGNSAGTRADVRGYAGQYHGQ